jgi:hypothetical protein
LRRQRHDPFAPRIEEGSAVTSNAATVALE